MAEHILSLKTQKALRPGFDWATAETRHVASALRPLMGSLGEIRHSPLLLRIMIPRTQSHRNTRPSPTPPLSSSSPYFMALWLFLDFAAEKKLSSLLHTVLKCLICFCHHRCWAAVAELEFKTLFSSQQREGDRSSARSWMKIRVRFTPKNKPNSTSDQHFYELNPVFEPFKQSHNTNIEPLLQKTTNNNLKK